MLEKNVSKRMSVEEAIGHPFMQGIDRLVSHYKDKFNGSPELFFKALLGHEESAITDTSMSIEKDQKGNLLGRKKKATP